MNENYPSPHKQDQAEVAKILAAAAVTLLALTNIAWLIAYSSLSSKVVGVTSPGPSVSAAPRVSASASPTPTPPTKGDISGTLTYPGESIPAMTICAMSTTDATKKFCVDHVPGTASVYTVTAPEGIYNVYASLKTQQGDITTSYKAYYDKYVTCGMSASCPASGHTQYLPVTVTAGMTTDKVDPGDWYNL
jgi:hypothetical protein